MKRFLQVVTNTTSLEKGVLQEVVAQDWFESKQHDIFSTAARLEKQSRASKQLISFLSKHMSFETCFTSASLLLHPVGKVCKGDFALYKDGSHSLKAGEVWFPLRAGWAALDNDFNFCSERLCGHNLFSSMGQIWYNIPGGCQFYFVPSYLGRIQR